MTLPIEFGGGWSIRAAVTTDAAPFARWMVSGAWLEYDAPWESRPTTKRARAQRFAEWFEKTEGPLRRAIIAHDAAGPVGSVSWYPEPRHPDAILAGINICEDAHLERGLGTQALRAWVDHLFVEVRPNRIGLHTYSLNPRMVRVAEKLGFTFEGADREIHHWQGHWVDRVRYGQLRSEWDRGR